MAGAPLTSQEKLVTAFTQGCVCGVTGPVARIDTHLSHVFLTPERAFKLKRAVTFPFVDFSTLDKRRQACEAEIAVNRVMAGDLYIGVEPIVWRDGAFSLGGDGEVADWVVAMRRFRQEDQFDQLAERGALSRSCVEQAVDLVANAHAGTPSTEHAGYPAQYQGVINGLIQTENDGAARLGIDPASPLLFDRLGNELTRISGLINSRRRGGKVKHGHGDLHLRNLCVFEQRPIAFDALEFDARLATGDVLYDLAFLLMDLRRAHLNEHANAAMNRYWDSAAEDEQALELLPFFMSLRAAVRMAVAVEAGDLKEALSYRTLGHELLGVNSAPLLVAIGGLSGTGKTAVAQALAPRLNGPAGARILSSDVLRKRAAGLAREERAPAASYAEERRAEVYSRLIAQAQKALDAGADVVADATFQSLSPRQTIAGVSARLKAFWLTAPDPVRLARVGQRTHDASDADVNVAAAQTEPEKIAPPWVRIDADRPTGEVVADVVQRIGPH